MAEAIKGHQLFAPNQTRIYRYGAMSELVTEKNASGFIIRKEVSVVTFLVGHSFSLLAHIHT